MNEYCEQHSQQTLAEGLAEYYATMPNLLPPEQLSPESQELFIPHDACHVVFGCDTSIHDEALVDTWTMFGSDVGIKRYLAYLKNPDAKQIFDDTGWWTMLKLSLSALPDLVRVIWRSRRMLSRWPWEHHTLYMHRRLDDIRKEFGIRVIRHRR